MEQQTDREYLEMMKKQWELLGINPTLIFKHLDPTHLSKTLKNFSENVERIIQGSLDQEAQDEESRGFCKIEIDEPFIKEESDVSDVEFLKSIACGSNLAYLNCQYLNTLRSFKPQFKIKQMLKREWGIQSREDLLKTTNWLYHEGDRKVFDLIWDSLQKFPEKKWLVKAGEIRLQLYSAEAHLDNLNEMIINIIKGFKILKTVGCFRFVKKPSIYTWDLGRAINLVRWGVDVQYLSSEEAQILIMQYASILQHTYTSWEGLSEGYLLGSLMWCGEEEELQDLLREHKILLMDKNSPFVTLSWE